ncbi:MAG: cytochrome c-type biogenesis protein CcmH [Myxococcales bacterium]|nr:cytochrome c-type biogenesis protein CcmH [Myxococcales bacterium]
MTLAPLLAAILAVTGSGLAEPPVIAEPLAPQRLAGEPLDPAREARVQALAKVLRCPVCQGLSIADSPSSMARAQLEKVRELVREGKTDQEIFAYFEARYGEFALLEPKAQGINLLAWVGPMALLLFGFFVILSQVRRRGSAVSPAQGGPPAAAPPAEDEYLRQVRSEIER